MTKFAYFNGQIRPIEEAKVSVMTNTFNYGTGCFGGIRGYWNEEHETLYVFRLHDHYHRFLNSARMLLAKLEYTPESLSDITVELLHKEGWRQNCYIRPLAYKADEMIGVRLHGLTDAVTIFSVPMDRYIMAEEGANVGTSSWRRVDDTAIPARGKFIGSYMNSALIKSEALLNGFDEAIVLNQDGHVSEASAANFMMIRGKKLITPPIYSNILEGITRRSLMHLAAEEFGLVVEEREIDRTELYIADEAFFCGTGAQIVAIASVDHRPIGEGHMGPLTKQIRDRYYAILHGNVPEYQDWLTPVHQPIFA